MIKFRQIIQSRWSNLRFLLPSGLVAAFAKLQQAFPGVSPQSLLSDQAFLSQVASLRFTLALCVRQIQRLLLILTCTLLCTV